MTSLVAQVTSGFLCEQRSYGQDSFVCVCNATYCDSFDFLETRPADFVQVFVSSRDALRFQKNIIQVDKGGESSPDVDIKVDTTKSFQSIIGFGAAFTDAAGISSLLLGDEMSTKVIDQYYSPIGLKYNLGRVVIGGSDFSDHKYSYDDREDGVEDLALDHFSLMKEDFSLKIPFIKRAQSLSTEELLLYASAWSAPAWMKTNNALNGRGFLKGNATGPYYEAWAKYYVKFLDAYKKEGIKFWGLTTGNEPINGLIPKFPFNCLGFTPSLQRDFIKYQLGPVLNASNYGHLKIMILDDQRYQLPFWISPILKDPEASKYVAGIGLHWYGDPYAPSSLLTRTHNKYPDKFILGTEATNVGKPLLGNWERGEKYLSSILTDTNNFMTGWVEWNFALNLEGGPNWVNASADSPIIVNATAGEFYKQPTYYALAHVTRFVPRNSKKVAIQVKDHSWKFPFIVGIEANSFVTPTNQKVTIVLNKYAESKIVKITEVDNNLTYQLTLPPKSFATFIRA